MPETARPEGRTAGTEQHAVAVDLALGRVLRIEGGGHFLGGENGKAGWREAVDRLGEGSGGERAAGVKVGDLAEGVHAGVSPP
jgi:hypothetical protein